MRAAELISALRQAPLFAGLVDDLVDCVAGGAEVFLQPGERLVTEGTPADYFYMLLDGELRITKWVGDAETLLTTYTPGTFFGEAPILLEIPYVASGYAVQPSRVFRLDRDRFWRMLSACPGVTRVILRTMADRVHSVQTILQDHARLVSLGTLAAGLAHEMNNPAMAIQRSCSWSTDLRSISRWPIGGAQWHAST